MYKVLGVFILSVLLTALVSCTSVCSDTGAWCYTWDEWYSSVSDGDVYFDTPEPTVEATPTETMPVSPLSVPVYQPSGVNFYEVCDWIGCEYFFEWIK